MAKIEGQLEMTNASNEEKEDTGLMNAENLEEEEAVETETETLEETEEEEAIAAKEVATTWTKVTGESKSEFIIFIGI